MWELRIDWLYFLSQLAHLHIHICVHGLIHTDSWIDYYSLVRYNFIIFCQKFTRLCVSLMRIRDSCLHFDGAGSKSWSRTSYDIFTSACSKKIYWTLKFFINIRRYEFDPAKWYGPEDPYAAKWYRVQRIRMMQNDTESRESGWCKMMQNCTVSHIFRNK